MAERGRKDDRSNGELPAADPTGLGLTEAAVVEAMQAYALAFAAPSGSDDIPFGAEATIRIRTRLRACVSDWAAAMRTNGEPPERVIVLLKEMLRRCLGAPEQHQGIAEQSVGWCIVAYFEGE